MHLIEQIVDAFLSPIKMLLSTMDEIVGLIITFLIGIIGLVLLPIRVWMLVGDLQDHLDKITLFINAIQWLSNGISKISTASSYLSSMTSGVMDMTVLGITMGQILYSAVGLVLIWLLLRFFPEISY
jgi:hypothetical protein